MICTSCAALEELEMLGNFFSILGDEWEVGWEGYEKLEGG